MHIMIIIRFWMINNKLKVNDDKREVLIVGSPHTHSKLSAVHEFLVGKSIKPSHAARNLGVVFDNKQVSMVNQCTNICKSANCP